MSYACEIVDYKIPPIQEVVEHESHGLLVNFIFPEQLTEATTELLHDRALATELNGNFCASLEEHFSLQCCLPSNISLIELVAAGILS